MTKEHLEMCKLPYIEKNGVFFQLTHQRKLSDSYHDHDFYETVVLLCGSCKHMVDDNVFHMEVGQVFFLKPNQYHILFDQSPDVNIASFSIDPKLMQNFFLAYGTDEVKPNICLNPDELERFSNMCERVYASDKNTSAVRCLIGMLMTAFVFENHEYAEIPENFNKVLLEMQKPEMTAEGMSAFLRLSNFSYPHLCRLTKRYLGMPPGEYITELRLKHAYDLITDTDESYENICEICGFSSFSHFCKLVRTKYKKTPAKIRQQAKNQFKTV